MKAKTSEWSLKNYLTDFEESHFEITPVSPHYQTSVLSFQHEGRISGNISTLVTPDMEISQLTVRSDVDLTTLQCDETDRYISTLVYKGNMLACYPEHKLKLEYKNEHHSFVHLQNTCSQHTLTAGDTSILYLNIKPETMQAFVPDWEQQSEKIINKKYGTHFYTSPAYSVRRNARLQQVVMALNNNTFGGVTRSLYMEAKAMELLALQLDDVVQQSKQLNTSSLISKCDYDKLMAMYEYINLHYLEPLSLSSLARQFLLNEFKLKQGFKQLFKQSAFNYIHTLRMEKAQELLRSGDRLVNEVSDMVGYSSVQNFSNAFYKMYRYRPNTIKPEAHKIAV